MGEAEWGEGVLRGGRAAGSPLPPWEIQGRALVKTPDRTLGVGQVFSSLGSFSATLTSLVQQPHKENGKAASLRAQEGSQTTLVLMEAGHSPVLVLLSQGACPGAFGCPCCLEPHCGLGQTWAQIPLHPLVAG